MARGTIRIWDGTRVENVEEADAIAKLKEVLEGWCEHKQGDSVHISRPMDGGILAVVATEHGEWTDARARWREVKEVAIVTPNVEQGYLANVPTDQFERDAWGLSED